MKSAVLKYIFSKKIPAILVSLATINLFVLSSCSAKKDKSEYSIAVYIPGIMADSAIYANLAEGVKDAVQEYNAVSEKKASVTVSEAGTNQAEWGTKLTALAATKKFDVIISSNPSLPEIAEPVSRMFPEQKFIFLDAAVSGNKNMAAVSYNQKEQAYLSGYIAGLFSKTKRVGLIAAQEYPVMNEVLMPYFAKGASDAVPETVCDFRIVGNWYDASKGAEITKAMASSGTDVILPICGGASRGVISAAKELGIHLVWFDENAFSKAPGTIISSCLVLQKKAAKETALDYLNGKILWGQTRTVGFSDGYIEFVRDDPLYESSVSPSIREKMDVLIESLSESN